MARSSCIIIGEGVRGELSFDQAQEDAPTRIDGTIEGLTPGEHGIHIHTFGDLHLYANHLEQAKLQLEREPRPSPFMKISGEQKEITDFRYEDFELSEYNPHPAIKAPISV